MDLKTIASNIKLLVFDVDGVMTDGSITYDENGKEYKTFNAKDGHGIVRMNKSGFITAIITARDNETVRHRAENLNITELYQGYKYKLPALQELMKKYNIPTARYEVFDNSDAAVAYVKKQNSYPAVIKADGLALGKGVIIAQNEAEAVDAIH